MMRFEWKKIFERRLNVAAMLLGYLLIGVCVFNYITQESFYDERRTVISRELRRIVWLGNVRQGRRR